MIMNRDAIRKFLFAGRAVFTITSTKTGTSFTYRFSEPSAPANEGAIKPIFAAVLTGPDNQRDYTYMGILNANTGVVLPTRASKVAEDAPSYRALNWYLAHLGDTRVEFRHEGRCGRCGRALTVPSSIDSGLGPECASKL
jgi:hypothetical protein